MLSIEAIIEFMDLWREIQHVPSLNNDEDCFSWTANGAYSATSAYEAYFLGIEHADYAKLPWENEAPPK